MIRFEYVCGILEVEANRREWLGPGREHELLRREGRSRRVERHDAGYRRFSLSFCGRDTEVD